MPAIPEGLRQRKVHKSSEEEDNEEPKAKELSPEEEKKKKYKSLTTRIVWGVPMVIFFAFLLLSDHILVALFVIILQIIVFQEVIGLRYREAKEKKLWGFRTLHWVLLLSTFFYFYGDLFLTHSSKFITLRNIEYLHRYHLAISFTLYVLVFLSFIITLKKGFYKYQLSQLAWTVMMLLIVVVQSHVVIRNIFSGLIWFIVPSSLIICNDVMAYACGFVLGKKFIQRPLTSLSPNKTWEGFIGALFFTMAFAFVFARALSYFDWFVCPKEFTSDTAFGQAVHCVRDPIFVPRDLQLPQEIVSLFQLVGISRTTVFAAPIQFHAVLFALFASLIAPFGGFFASAMKRAYGVKDFGSLFPGHGGMTDRMDCQFLMGLFVFVYYNSFIKPSAIHVAQVLFLIDQLALEDQVKIFETLGKSLGRT